jgi:hypothetical protein
MTGDQEFFVGRDYPGRDAACHGTDARAVGLIGCGIEVDAQPSGVTADPLAQRPTVLANRGGEHDGIQSAECG